MRTARSSMKWLTNCLADGIDRLLSRRFQDLRPEQMPFSLALGEAWLDGFVSILAQGLSAPEESNP